jgi:hypothetical protein
MHRYETPNDIPHHLQDCCESWHTGYRFVHPFRVEVFPFESDPDLIAELQRAEDAFYSSFKSKNWMFTIDMIVGWKHRFRYLNSLIEPAIPRNAEGDRAYWSLIVYMIRNSPILHGQEEHFLRALDCGRRGKAATLFGNGNNFLGTIWLHEIPSIQMPGPEVQHGAEIAANDPISAPAFSDLHGCHQGS